MNIFNVLKMCVLSVFLVACGGGDGNLSVESKPFPHRNVLLIGDSLTDDRHNGADKYWTGAVQKEINEQKLNATFINLAKGGENSGQALNNMSEYLKHDAPLVFIFIGTNDVFYNYNPEDTEANIRKIMNDLNAKQPRYFILVNLKHPEGMRDYLKKNNVVNNPDERVDANEKIIPRIVKDYTNIAFVYDYYKDLDQSLDSKDLTPDGFHGTEDSHKIIAKTLFPYFKEVLENMPK